jgi:hypothetical protein
MNMKKHKISCSTAKFIMESVETVEANKAYQVVTEFAVGDDKVEAGTMVQVLDVADAVKFAMPDGKELSIDSATFAANTQLMSDDNVAVNEALDKSAVKNLPISALALDNMTVQQSKDKTYIALKAQKMWFVIDNASKKCLEAGSATDSPKSLEGFEIVESPVRDHQYLLQNAMASFVNEAFDDKLKAFLDWLDDDDAAKKSAELTKFATDRGYDANSQWEYIWLRLSDADKKALLKIANLDEAAADDVAIESAVVSMLMQSIQTAHVMHINNPFDAAKVSIPATHAALEQYYTELPELADRIAENMRFDKGITIDSSVVLTWSDPVVGIMSLRQALLNIRDAQSAATQSDIDAVCSFMTNIMYKLVFVAGFAKPVSIVTESEDWAEKFKALSPEEKANNVKLAIMTDMLKYNSSEMLLKAPETWPQELKDAIKPLLESAEDAANKWSALSHDDKVKVLKQFSNEDFDATTLADKDWSELDKVLKQTLMKQWNIDESLSDNARKFAMNFVAVKDDKKLSQIDELIAKELGDVDLAIDIAYDKCSAATKKKLSELVGASFVNESASRKRSTMIAAAYVNENFEDNKTYKLVNSMRTIDGVEIPAGTLVTYTGNDSNVDAAYVTVGEDAYTVSFAELMQATKAE